MTESAVVEFENVRVELGEQPVLQGLDLRLDAGETLVLLGRSGSGKSTTLRLANGLVMPTAGEVRVEGRPTASWDRHRLRRRIGYVIQEIGLFPHFTVERNVATVPRLLGWDEARTRARTHELLALVGLPPERFAGRYPHELSGGQRQRVGIARALAAEPALLLCDEPFGALDPVTRYELQRELHGLRRSLGTTLLFVTHDLREALFLADRIAFLDRGLLRFVGTPDAFRSAGDPAVARFRAAAELERP
ncbi:MAG: ATP-binding cassette domain-containing protein [Gemmatimonadota bacterium]